MVTLPVADLYHTGVVVPDLAVAKAEYARLGFSFGFGSEAMPPDTPSEMPVIFETGLAMVKFVFSCTTPGPHRIELAQAIAGTIWEVLPGRSGHHIGYWCDDVARTSAQLERMGFPCAARIGVTSLDAAPAAVMHRTDSGMYIELVARANRSLMFPED
ncbi:MAG: VOC family protein [Acidimicrobiia bacterium]